MAKRQKVWMYVPPRPKKTSIPERLKIELAGRAEEFVEKHLKPTHIEPPPKDPEFNYLINIWTKWFRNYFYFYDTFACPFENRLSDTFDRPFVRMEYAGDDRFHLSYFRHNDKWNEVYHGLTIDECFEVMREEPLFTP